MTEWEWFDDVPTFNLFTKLLFMVNWKDKKWHGEVVKRGEVITSLEHLKDFTKLSVMQIRTSLKKLQSTGEIKVETTNRYTKITINNYRKYQSSNKQTTNHNTDIQCDSEEVQQTDNKQITNKQQTNNKQITTTKEYKEIKEYKNIYSDIQKSYNQICKTLPQCTVMSAQRKKMVDARLNDYSQDQIVEVFRLANKSDFLSGRNKKWTGCNFDWLMRPNNFIKVIEKTYNQGTHKIQSHEYDFDELERKIQGGRKNV